MTFPFPMFGPGLIGGASFNPLSLSPAAWYDLSDTSTLFQDSGASVPVTASGQTLYYLKDKSGNNIHLSASSSPTAPTWVVSGGYDYAQFTGSSSQVLKSIVTPSFQLATIELYMVAQQISRVGSDGYVSFATSSGADDGVADAMVLQSETNSSFAYAALFDRAYILDVTIPTPLNVYWAYKTSASNVDVSAPGESLSSASFFTAETTQSGHLFMGCRTNNDAPTTPYLTGNIYQLIVFNSPLSSGDRASLITYLGAKAGLTV